MNCGRKNDSSPREKIKNQREIHSQDWENEKMRKIAFPKLGKTEKCRRLHFQPLGKLKNTKSRISNPLEERKMLKITRRS